MGKVSKEIPLAEITLRRYEKPLELEGRDLVKKFCLSIGLLQPGDSRDVIVDVLRVLLISREEKRLLSSKDVENQVINLRKKEKLPLSGVASSNIRRQLKRLKDLFLIENINNSYRVSEFDSFENIFNEKIEKYYIDSILSRVKEYFKAVK